MKLTKEQAINVLKTVKDPELNIDVWTLGLIYDIKIAPPADESARAGEDGIDILMTLTSPFCPFADELIESVEKALAPLANGEARVNITFDPPWEPTTELRTILGI
ncbi:MAG: metal-sulfur cluster assembly factor [Patescibacteria group bacterium]